MLTNITFQNLKNHMRTCKGKFIFTCTYCPAKFADREKFTSHLIKNHKPQSNFETTSIFVGETSNKVRNYGKGVPKYSERSLVILTPHLTTTDEIFTLDVKSELRKLMEWDLGMFTKYILYH